ncbi:MAG: hypothetical protein ACTHQM_23650 [Thermoanaerobaculia bacterium]
MFDDEILNEVEEINSTLQTLSAGAGDTQTPVMPFANTLLAKLPADAMQARAMLSQLFPIKNGIATYVEPNTFTQTVYNSVVPLTGEDASMQLVVNDLVTTAQKLLDEIVPQSGGSAVRLELENLLKAFAEPFVVDRIDLAFETLSGQIAAGEFPSADKIGGALGRLRDELALCRNCPETLPDDERRTPFTTLVVYTNMLYSGWNALKQRDDLLLGRVIREMHELLTPTRRAQRRLVNAFEAEWIGHPERMTISLKDNANMTVANLLSWIEDLASPRTAEVILSGREAIVSSFLPTVTKIHAAIEDGLLPLLAENAMTNDDCKPASVSLGTPRTRRAAGLLLQHICALQEKAEKLPQCDPPPPPPAYGSSPAKSDRPHIPVKRRAAPSNSAQS